MENKISNVLELRIDNLVLNRHNEVHRFGFMDFMNYRHPQMGGYYGFCGIRLTDDLLLEFGFEKGEKTVQEGQSFNIEIGADRKLHINALNYNPHAWIRDYFSQSRLDDFSFLCQPKYVHQLQNLYHCLTGQELTIK